MSIVNTTISATTDGTYGLTNNLIGQIKAIIDDDPNVTIESDNNPANSSIRVLVYSVANCGHRFSLESAASVKITAKILALDNATALQTKTTGSAYVSGTAYPIKLLYNNNFHALFFTHATDYPSFLAFDTGDPAGWYQQYGFNSWINTGYYNKAYLISSDTAIDVSQLSYPYLVSGKLLAIPTRFYDVSGLYSYYNVNYYSSLALIASGVHQDSVGDYYVSFSAATYGITIKDVDL